MSLAFAQDYPPPQANPAGQNYPQQQNYPPPPTFAPGQLESMVSRIALYPDALLAQVFAAATFPDQVPDAARWADEHASLHGNDLANAMTAANLPFDPAVQALIPFPTVLDLLASDMNWTSQLGNAVLANRAAVMDAVQRERADAQRYGYLQSTPQMRVYGGAGAIVIAPVDPGFIYVPVYNPYLVFAPPRPGFFVGSAIRFSPGFAIGFGFTNWGWGGGFNWAGHSLIVHNAVWGRTWYNRASYVHNWGNWNGGHWRNAYVSRNVTVNNYNVNRTVNRTNEVNRYTNNYAAHPSTVAPNRGFERQAQAQQRPAAAFRGTENTRVEHNMTPAVHENHANGHAERGNEREGRR